MSKTRYNSIDLGKFVMAIVVIAIHTCPLINCNNSTVLKIYNQTILLAVPFFFLATGFFLGKKMNGEIPDILVIKRYVIKTIKLYLIWMLVYTPLSVYDSIVSHISLKRSIVLYLRGIFLMGEQHDSWPLWYLLSTIYALLFIMWLRKKNVSFKGLLVVSLVFAFVSVGVDSLTGYYGDLLRVLSIIRDMLLKAIETGRIFRGMIYIPIGMYFAKKDMSFWVSGLMLLASYATNYFTENSFVSGLLVVVSSICLFDIIKKIQLPDSNVFPMLRSISVVMYFMHMYVWVAYFEIVYGRKTFGVDSFGFTVLFSAVIGFIYTIVRRFTRAVRTTGSSI